MLVVALMAHLHPYQKWRHWCCGTLSPSLPERCVMSSVEKEWGNEKEKPTRQEKTRTTINVCG